MGGRKFAKSKFNKGGGMKKFFLTFFLLTFAVYIAASVGQTPNTNFRQASWGMSMGQIIKAEGKQPVDKQKSNSSGLDIISYKGQAGNLECLYAYYFAEDKLVQGRYIFITDHSNNNLYIEDFNTVKNSLTEKYGKPSADQTIWNNDLYKSDRGEWGMAVSIGHLIFQTKWTLDDTEIILQLRGDNYHITHTVQYESTIKEHIELMKRAEEKAKSGIW
jgi:hypothetical protein